MNKPPSWTSREESLLLLNAYLDDELDAASVLDVERRVDSDAALKAELTRLRELRDAFTAHVIKDRASDAFRARIAAIADPAAVTSRPSSVATMRSKPPARLQAAPGARRTDWRQMAAAAAIAAVLASLGTYAGLQQTASKGEIAEIVAGHQRALLATAPFDVASSDRHTVKPWFDGKLAVSPLVIDLSEAGFPLIGGRVDVVDGHAVPTSVYKRRAHVISLTAVPKPGSKDDGSPLKRTTRDGYTLLTWPGRDFTYSAVSDVAPNELEEFATRWRTGAAGN
jgi:anti-sigma factor RsiW